MIKYTILILCISTLWSVSFAGLEISGNGPLNLEDGGRLGVRFTPPPLPGGRTVYLELTLSTPETIRISDVLHMKAIHGSTLAVFNFDTNPIPLELECHSEYALNCSMITVENAVEYIVYFDISAHDFGQVEKIINKTQHEAYPSFHFNVNLRADASLYELGPLVVFVRDDVTIAPLDVASAFLVDACNDSNDFRFQLGVAGWMSQETYNVPLFVMTKNVDGVRVTVTSRTQRLTCNTGKKVVTCKGERDDWIRPGDVIEINISVQLMGSFDTQAESRPFLTVSYLSFLGGGGRAYAEIEVPLLIDVELPAPRNVECLENQAGELELTWSHPQYSSSPLCREVVDEALRSSSPKAVSLPTGPSYGEVVTHMTPTANYKVGATFTDSPIRTTLALIDTNTRCAKPFSRPLEISVDSAPITVGAGTNSTSVDGSLTLLDPTAATYVVLTITPSEGLSVSADSTHCGEGVATRAYEIHSLPRGRYQLSAPDSRIVCKLDKDQIASASIFPLSVSVDAMHPSQANGHIYFAVTTKGAGNSVSTSYTYDLPVFVLHQTELSAKNLSLAAQNPQSALRDIEVSSEIANHGPAAIYVWRTQDVGAYPYIEWQIESNVEHVAHSSIHIVSNPPILQCMMPKNTIRNRTEQLDNPASIFVVSIQCSWMTMMRPLPPGNSISFRLQYQVASVPGHQVHTSVRHKDEVLASSTWVETNPVQPPLPPVCSYDEVAETIVLFVPHSIQLSNNSDGNNSLYTYYTSVGTGVWNSFVRKRVCTTENALEACVLSSVRPEMTYNFQVEQQFPGRRVASSAVVQCILPTRSASSNSSQPLRVELATWNPTSHEIHVLFSTAVDTYSAVQLTRNDPVRLCDSILTLEVLQMLGVGYHCSFYNMTTLHIHIGNNATILPSNGIVLRSSLLFPLSGTWDTRVSSLHVPLSVAQDHLFPRARIQGPHCVWSDSDSVVLDASLSDTNGRDDVQYVWDLLPPTRSGARQWYSQELRDAINSQTGSVLQVPWYLIEEDKEYTIQLTITNFAGFSDSAEHVLFRSPKETPEFILQPSAEKSRPGYPLQVSLRQRHTSAESRSRNVFTIWAILSESGDVLEAMDTLGSELYIPAGMLQKSGVSNVTISARTCYNDSGCTPLDPMGEACRCTVLYTGVDVTYGSPQIRLYSSEVTTPIGDTITLQAYITNKYEDSLSRSVYWECQPADGGCTVEKQDALSAGVQISKPGAYNVVVTLYESDRADESARCPSSASCSSASVHVFSFAEDDTQVQLISPTDSIPHPFVSSQWFEIQARVNNPEEVLGFQWDVVDLGNYATVDTSAQTTNTLILPPNTLTGAMKYSICAKVTSRRGGPARACTVLTTAKRISQGSCKIIPTVGYIDTEYSLSCSKWASSYDWLRYSITAESSNFGPFIVSGEGFNPKRKFRLPPGDESDDYTLKMTVSVHDAVAESLIDTLFVQVWPGELESPRSVDVNKWANVTATAAAHVCAGDNDNAIFHVVSSIRAVDHLFPSLEAEENSTQKMNDILEQSRNIVYGGLSLMPTSPEGMQRNAFALRHAMKLYQKLGTVRIDDIQNVLKAVDSFTEYGENEYAFDIASNLLETLDLALNTTDLAMPIGLAAIQQMMSVPKKLLQFTYGTTTFMPLETSRGIRLSISHDVKAFQPLVRDQTSLRRTTMELRSSVHQHGRGDGMFHVQYAVTDLSPLLANIPSTIRSNLTTYSTSVGTIGSLQSGITMNMPASGLGHEGTVPTVAMNSLSKSLSDDIISCSIISEIVHLNVPAPRAASYGSPFAVQEFAEIKFDFDIQFDALANMTTSPACATLDLQSATWETSTCHVVSFATGVVTCSCPYIESATYAVVAETQAAGEPVQPPSDPSDPTEVDDGISFSFPLGLPTLIGIALGVGIFVLVAAAIVYSKSRKERKSNQVVNSFARLMRAFSSKLSMVGRSYRRTSSGPPAALSAGLRGGKYAQNTVVPVSDQYLNVPAPTNHVPYPAPSYGAGPSQPIQYAPAGASPQMQSPPPLTRGSSKIVLNMPSSVPRSDNQARRQFLPLPAVNSQLQQQGGNDVRQHYQASPVFDFDIYQRNDWQQ